MESFEWFRHTMTSCPLMVFAFASRRASILYFTIGSGMYFAKTAGESSRRSASSRGSFMAAESFTTARGERSGGRRAGKIKTRRGFSPENFAPGLFLQTAHLLGPNTCVAQEQDAA